MMARLGHRAATVALRHQHATQERGRASVDRLGVLMRSVAAESNESAGSVALIKPRTASP